MSQFMLKEAHTLSVERIWGEWYKWAALGENYLQSLEFLWNTNWISLWPDLERIRGIEQDPVWHPEGEVWTHTEIVVQNASEIANLLGYLPIGNRRVQLIFAALLHDIGKGTTSEISKTSKRIIHPKHELVGVDLAKKFLESIGAPRWVGTKTLPMIREHMFRRGRNPETISKRAIRRLSVRLDPVTIKELVDLIHADTMDRTTDDEFTAAMLRVAGEVKVEDSAPKKILKGEHLIKKGLSPGPLFGVILKAAYEKQLDGEFSTKYGALVWLEQYLHEIYLSEKD
jgi:tRNA nucleotidyltransferase (CCA-adding enzyme)